MSGPPRQPPVPRPPGASRYAWFFGVAVVLAVVLISLNNVTHHAPTDGPAAGRQMPPFAMPLALTGADADADVAVRAGQGARHAACDVRGPTILNSCQLAARGPVALAFFFTRGADCTPALDRLDAVRGDFPGLQVAGVVVRGGRDEVRQAVRAHRWSFPVGWDRDGTVSVLYGVAGCPQITVAARGGSVRGTIVGTQSEARLRARLGALLAPRGPGRSL